MHRHLVVAAIIAAVALGCGSAAEQDVARDDTTGEITEQEDIGVFRLREGDCLMLPTGEAADQDVETLEAIPCTEPHDAEVLALVEVEGDDDAPFPGELALSSQAEADCVAAFDASTGRDFATDPDWDLTFLSPTDASWSLGNDREIVCIAIPLDGRPTTTLVTA